MTIHTDSMYDVGHYYNFTKRKVMVMSISEQLGPVKEVQLSQGTVRYREQGSGQPLLFVHGFLVNGDLWRGVAPRLAGEYRCIVPDWPLGSHTLAMNADAQLAPPQVAELIIEFADALGLDSPVLVANDSGGALSQMAVASAPERFGALVLTPCDGFDKFPPAPYNAMPPIARTPVLRALLAQSMRLRFIRWAAFRPLLKHGYDGALVRSWCQPITADPGVRRDALKFMGGASTSQTLDAATRFAEFRKPVLLLWPPQNRFFKYSLAERLAAAFPDSRLVPIDDGATFLSLDQPERVATEIAAFIEEAVLPAAVGQPVL